MPTLKLYAGFRELAERKELELGGTTVRALLQAALEAAPALRRAIPMDGDVTASAVLILNGINVTDLDSPVAADDVLAVFPPIAGG